MKMKKYYALLLTVLMLCAMLGGCGASKSTSSMSVYAPAADSYASAEMGAVLTGNGGSDSLASADPSVLPENRKFVITGDMRAETDNMDDLLAAVNAKISELGGYVEDQSIDSGSRYSGTRYRNANLTVRIPTENLSAFTETVGAISNVTYSSQTATDITLQYVDTESRLSALNVEKDRLTVLMEQAETMADLLAIEERLTYVCADIESYSSRLRVYDNQVDYATISLSVSEVTEYTPVAEKTTWEKISTGFVASLKGLGNGIVAIFVWILVELPYLVVIALIVTGIVLLCRRRAKKGKKVKASVPPPQTDAPTDQK